jgi:hypothetical protein
MSCGGAASTSPETCSSFASEGSKVDTSTDTAVPISTDRSTCAASLLPYYALALLIFMALESAAMVIAYLYGAW